MLFEADGLRESGGGKGVGVSSCKKGAWHCKYNVYLSWPDFIPFGLSELNVPSHKYTKRTLCSNAERYPPTR